IEHLVPGQLLEYCLLNLETRHDIQGEMGQHAQCAKGHHIAVELRIPAPTACSEPSASTSSTPRTAVARLPWACPEPWVPVETAPATEIWGREARLCSAK